MHRIASHRIALDDWVGFNIMKKSLVLGSGVSVRIDRIMVVVMFVLCLRLIC